MKAIFWISALFLSFFLLSDGVTAAAGLPAKDEAGAEGKVEKSEEAALRYEGFHLEGDKEKTMYAVSVYRPNYFLPVTYNENPNEKTYLQDGRDVPNHYEAKFQLSFKVCLLNDIFKDNGDLYIAYTQMSLWQIYNESAPFRETNYEPEVFLKFDTDVNVLGFQNRLLRVGLNHQSNGQGGAFSRSWNRVFAEFVLTRGDFVIGVEPWFRIPESDENDNNPDIYDYLGYGQITGAYKWKNNVFSVVFRNNLDFDVNRCGIELGWSYRLLDNLRLYLQYFNGYGESLIDYDNLTNRIGFGLMINDWL